MSAKPSRKRKRSPIADEGDAMMYSQYSSSSEEERSPKRRKLTTPPTPTPVEKPNTPSPQKNPLDEEDEEEEIEEEEEEEQEIEEEQEETGPAHASPEPIVSASSPVEMAKPIEFEFDTTKEAVYHILLENGGEKMTVNQLYEEYNKLVATKRAASVTRDTVGRNATYLVRDLRLRSRAPRGSELYFWIPGPEGTSSDEEDYEAPVRKIRRRKKKKNKKPKKVVRRRKARVDQGVTFSVSVPPHLLDDADVMNKVFGTFSKWRS